MPPSLPHVVADLPLSPALTSLLESHVTLLPWLAAQAAGAEDVQAIYTYGHPHVGAELLGRLRGVRVISNFGVGVDHIDVAAAAARGIPVGNTPGILDGATADMAFALLLAAGRRLVEAPATPAGRTSSATIPRTSSAAKSTAARSASSAWVV